MNIAVRVASMRRQRRRAPRDVGRPNSMPIICPRPRTTWRNSWRDASSSSRTRHTLPMAAACSTMCSSSKTESVASPATMAIGLFLNVVEWTIARSMEL